MRKLSAKWVPKCLNADQKRQRCQSSEQLLEFFRPDPNDFLSRLVTMDETWLYHYNSRQNNNQWSGSIAAHPAPKNSECKNPLEKFSPRFFGIKTASSSLIIFQRANLSTRSITHLCWCNWRTFWRKKRRGKVTKGGLFSHDNAPAHRALATQKKLAYLGFQCLDHTPYSPDLAPLDYQLFPALKKTIERLPIFVRRGGHCCRGDLVGRTTFIIFLSGLQKLEQGAKRCTELRGEYVE